MPSSVKEVIIHCQKQIKKEPPPDKLLHYLRRLSRLRITIDDLSETGVGKTVNQLSRLDGEVGRYAGKIVQEWKAMVETETAESDHSDEESSASESELKIDTSKEITSETGLNFSDVLGCMNKTTTSSSKTKTETKTKPKATTTTPVPSSSKTTKKNGVLESTILPPVKIVKTEPITNDNLTKHKSVLNNTSTLSYESYAPPVPTIQLPKPSYPIVPSMDIFPKHEKLSRTKWEDDLLSVPENPPPTDYDTLSSMMSSRKDRTKVYSGNKMGFVGEVPSLFDMCIRIIQENLDSLGFTGGVPYDILKPALQRASIKQLAQIEFYNPYLLESTDELWKLHCHRECRMQKPQEMESWRELYYRYQDEKQEKLKSLASKVKKSVELAQQPVRKAKLAYVEPSSRGPKFSKSKAATIKNGMKTLKHREEKGGQTGGPSYSASSGGKTQVNQTVEEAAIVISSDSRARSSPSIPRDAPAAMKKPKKAPLMQKTLKLIRTVYRR